MKKALKTPSLMSAVGQLECLQVLSMSVCLCVLCSELGTAVATPLRILAGIRRISRGGRGRRGVRMGRFFFPCLFFPLFFNGSLVVGPISRRRRRAILCLSRGFSSNGELRGRLSLGWMAARPRYALLGVALQEVGHCSFYRWLGIVVVRDGWHCSCYRWLGITAVRDGWHCSWNEGHHSTDNEETTYEVVGMTV